MDWKLVNKVPEYNPFQIELARKSRGLCRSELSRICKIQTKRISEIENGNSLPNDDEIKRLSIGLDYPKAFFQQWHEFTVEFNGCFGKNIQIDYYKYKIFRDINPPQMKIIDGIYNLCKNAVYVDDYDFLPAG